MQVPNSAAEGFVQDFCQLIIYKDFPRRTGSLKDPSGK